MSEIIALLICLVPHVSSTKLRQLQHVIFALLCIPNRATMLGLSRWTEKGGSYRTLQRIYQSKMDWALLHWQIIKAHLIEPDGLYLLAGDDVVVSKAGKQTYGVGRFYSGLAQHVIPSVSFLAISLLDIRQRRSYPLQIEQHQPQSQARPHVSDKPKRKRGRPKGSKNHVKSAPILTPELSILKRMLCEILTYLGLLRLKHIVLDGKFGNYPATWAVQQTGLHIISKMRQDAALYLPYTGSKPVRGSTPRYGAKINDGNLAAQALVDTRIEGDYQIDTYQMQLYHKDYPALLNVVVLVKTHLKTGKRSHVVLFSTDLDLSAAQIVDFYSLRFQIEFNFRDAKQYWGLEDFMNITPTAVSNAVNLAFLMVNLSMALLKLYRQHDPDFSVLDLKAQFRARRYLDETIKMLPNPPNEHLISRIWHKLTRFGSIRTRHIHTPAA
jgi:putative transposase